MLREQLLQKMREMRQDVKTPRLYNLGADKTYDAAKYEHLVLGPVLSDQHGLIKYSNSTLDLLQEDSPPKEDTLPRVPEQLPSKFGMTAKATALSRRWLGESHGPRTDEKMEGSVALGGRQFRDVEKERLVKSGATIETLKKLQRLAEKDKWYFSFDLENGFHTLGIGPGWHRAVQPIAHGVPLQGSAAGTGTTSQ
ncbi:hypothetical protein CYMTET_34600 [Cymbomonas tetramitiformis]|uniref:Reverse transcriptase n=1 Tax=Cymbomonas tetramitiformis TaxID=36881 RepID=A0AAE0FAX6_9CHLO|nr:hypothetical protein CYMTET_34600 [Cymbomonas tetramitiformis]